MTNRVITATAEYDHRMMQRQLWCMVRATNGNANNADSAVRDFLERYPDSVPHKRGLPFDPLSELDVDEEFYK